jgi:hypothetical protein
VDEGKAVDDGKGMETTVDGMAGGGTVNKAATRGPTVVGIVGGIKRDNGLGRTMQPGKCSPPIGSQAWEAEKAQLVQENQQLRSAAANAATEAEERRRAAAELEKAKAEIERCDRIVFLERFVPCVPCMVGLIAHGLLRVRVLWASQCCDARMLRAQIQRRCLRAK